MSDTCPEQVAWASKGLASGTLGCGNLLEGNLKHETSCWRICAPYLLGFPGASENLPVQVRQVWGTGLGSCQKLLLTGPQRGC